MDDKIIITISITIACLVLINSAMVRFFMKKITKIIDLLPEIERFLKLIGRFEIMMNDFSLNTYKVEQMEKSIKEIKDDVNFLKDEIKDIKTNCEIKNRGPNGN
ncbi:MAG: hypothetical protein JSU91_01800 [Thermoplasmatales archaeon]|nr:MAG: hypothetical protein JSU91_01800 [Thermoplasmatales archaeon]